MSVPWVLRCLLGVCLAYPAFAQAETAFFAAKGAAPSRQMVIYSSLDTALAAPLIKGFQHDHPGVAVRYEDLLTGTLYERIVTESDSAGQTADFAFSSAMDLQVKLANDGYGRAVINVHSADWPDWAMWRHTAYALTFEPAVFAYHRPSFAATPPPATRADLMRWMTEDPGAARGRVGTYDIARSGVGYLFLARDQDLFPGIWQVIEAMGQAGVQQYATTGEILQRIERGEIAVGYNLLGSYVAEWARRAPETVGMILPKDFTVVTSRVALVPRAAASPDLGEAFLAWMMSPEGQLILSQTLRLPAVSLEVAGQESPVGGMADLSGLRLKPVPVGPGLLAYLDHSTRTRLIARWQAALAPLQEVVP